MMKTDTLALISILTICTLSPGQDDGTGSGDPVTIQDLQKKIEQLEARQDELTRQLAEQAEAADAAQGKSVVWSTVDINIYGYIKLDAAFDSAKVNTGNFARWVESEEGRSGDTQFNMTANQTRLGLQLRGPDVQGVQTGGLVEMDFYGGGTENKPNPMMRKAYLTVNWPGWDFEIRAGQDSDIISPLVPDTVNYTVQWWAGNIGYRRPQLRLTKGLELGSDARLVLQAAAARTIGEVSEFDDVMESGSDAGYPTIQARAALSFPFLGPTATTIGTSGHWAQEEYDTPDGDTELDTWSVNLELSQPLTTWLRIKAEGFVGENLDAYLGGIGQGTNLDFVGDPPTDLASANEIYSYGGWIAAGLGPFEAWSFNMGASVEQLDGSDIDDGQRHTNNAYYVNAIYTLFKTTQLGLEVAWWRTEYKNLDDGEALRVQAAMIFKF